MAAGEVSFELGGRVALVTGAGQGVGRGIALALARHGARVAVNDISAERAEAVAAEIRALGADAVAAPFDVGSLEGVRAGVAAIEGALGPVAILVNNAGNAGVEGYVGFPVFWESDPAHWHRYFHVNLFGVMNCAHAVLPGMVAAKHGRIVTIISDAGRTMEARQADYGAAKAGAAGFMRCLAADAARHGVTANSVAIATIRPVPDEQMDAYLATDRAKAQLSRYAIRRYGQPEDVAGVVLLLASDAGAWITGQTYPVNGGYSVAL